jgi:hypothetical protein
MANYAHDEYGKQVIRQADARALIYGQSRNLDYGAGHPCQIDATVEDIAIEFESRTGKQVRGAVLDLICHPLPKKILALMPEHMDASVEAQRCARILSRFLSSEEDFRVVVLKGSGRAPSLLADAEILANAIRELTG